MAATPTQPLAVIADEAIEYVESMTVTSVQANGPIAVLKGRVDDVFVKAKVSVSNVRDSVIVKTRPAVIKVQGGMVRVQGVCNGIKVETVAYGVSAKERAVHSFCQFRSAIEQNSSQLVDHVANFYAASTIKCNTAVSKLTNPFFLYAKEGYAVGTGKFGRIVVNMRAIGTDASSKAFQTYSDVHCRVTLTADSAVQRAVAARAALTDNATVLIEPYSIKVKDGVMYVKGRVGETKVRMTTRITGANDRVISAVHPYCTRAQEGIRNTKELLNDRISIVSEHAADRYTQGKQSLKETAGSIHSGARTAAADDRFRATAAAAVTGAAAMSATGGTAGLFTGGAVGAALGTVPAVFTFGLSIPVGAAIGSGAGLCMGAAVGGAAGFVGGGFTGYGVHAHKDAIEGGVGGVVGKVKAATQRFMPSRAS